MATWHDLIKWSTPRSVAMLTRERGARSVIPTEPGFYAFVSGCHPPSPDRTLYLGIATSARGLRGRLGSYLRAEVSAIKSENIRHEGKRKLAFARIKGISAQGKSESNTAQNDNFIHVCWTPMPVIFAPNLKSEGSREWAFLLERALIDFYRPIFNTADWERDLVFDMDDNPYDGIDFS